MSGIHRLTHEAEARTNETSEPKGIPLPMKTTWSFDLGKASIGEAVRDLRNHSFPHKASLLLPEDFAETQTAASRRRMMRTREAHKAREAWLDALWRAAGLTPLVGRRVQERDGKWQAVEETPEQKTEREERLEREFPKKGDTTCYNSALLRIKLLRGEKLEPWQIYKALHSAIQKRGYGRVPWAAREAKRGEKSEEEIVEALLKKEREKLSDEEKIYRAAVEAWPHFKDDIRARKLEMFERLQPSPDERKAHEWKDDYYFVPPCYYDAAKMKLWQPGPPEVFSERIDCHAESTRRVRFARADVEKEIATLARNAAVQLPALAEMFARAQREGWTLRDEKSGRTKTFPVVAEDIGAFLVHGPAGDPLGAAENDFAAYLDFRTERGIHPGSADDWMGAMAQKTPRFDNRIINDCALLPPERFQVCKAEPRLDAKTGKPFPDSLLHCEAVCLMKLKNLRVEKDGVQRKLLPGELRDIFAKLRADALAVKSDAKDWPEKVADRFAIIKSEWGSKKGFARLGLCPMPGHEEVKAPNVGGRSRYSRSALRLIRAEILAGQTPSAFRNRLLTRDAVLLAELGLELRDVPAPPRARIEGCPEPQRCPYILPSDLKFLNDQIRTGDTWEDLYFPEQRLDALDARHTDDDGQLNLDSAIRDLIGSINDPIVRHRLSLFSERLNKLRFGCPEENIPAFGVPQEIVIEFVRDKLPESFLSQSGQRDYGQWLRDKEKARSEAKAITAELGATARDAAEKYEMLKAQGFECIYLPNGSLNVSATRQALGDTKCIYTDQRVGISNIDELVIDHIVPQRGGFNGPDSFLNKVVTTRHVNENMKGCRTPYQWFHQDMPELWAGFADRVQKRLSSLGRKKVQLLTREDASELAERYTALAETAWISRLAQKIVGLHFGWRNGLDTGGEKPVKRVTVVSGGLTGRVRRKYRLNSILNRMPVEWFATEFEKAKAGRSLSPQEDRDLRKQVELEWESKAEKNRGDKRHHALDAMVINFIPQWARDENKEHFFRFPDSIHRNAKAFFQEQIDQVFARNVAFRKPRLAESIYGARDNRSVIVHREPVFDLAYNTEKQKPIFDLEYLRDKIKKVRGSCSLESPESTIVGLLERFLNEGNDDEAAWRDFCANLHLPQRDGGRGPRVVKVTVKAGEPPEYVELSKDKTGAYRKGKKGHRGQIIYLLRAATKKDAVKETIEVRPVYVFESRTAVEKKLKDEHGDAITIYGFFQSGCLIAVEREVAHEKKPLPAGTYLLNTVRAGGDVKLTTQNGKTHPDIPRYSLKNLIAAGLRRAD